MKRMLFNATHAEELRVAIVDGQRLIDIDIETAGREQRKSNIYKGVITRVEPSLEACFVNYGEDRHGFLPFKEISKQYFKEGADPGRSKIQEAISEGMELLVQVEKEERGNKGAALTTFISLAGRYLVLMPNNPRGGGVSRRIEGEERQELREALDKLEYPKGMSIIARTAGIGRSVEELQWDLNYLLQLWNAVDSASGSSSGPFLIYQESSLVIRAIRDYFHPDIGEVLIDTDEIYEQARQFMQHVMPDMMNLVKRYRDDIPLFSRFQIEHQIETAYSRMVPLPSGGAIVIDHTEALVSIDVNSARSTRGSDIEDTALRTNVEAADEVARQLRLRDLGGLIVIDFIDMEKASNQKEVEQRVKEALHFDRARVQMGKISRFGLMELSRQRIRPALNEGSHATCPRCNGTGVIRDTESTALHVLRLLQEEAMKEGTAALHAQVPVDVATFLLNEKRAEIFKLESRLKVSILLLPSKYLETPHYEVTRIRHDDERLDETRSSFELVTVKEDASYYEKKAESAAGKRQEPMIKGVVPAIPAPPPSERPRRTAKTAPAGTDKAERSFFEKIIAWFKGEPKPEQTAKALPAPAKKAEGNQGGRGDGRNNRNRNRRRGGQRNNEEGASATQNASADQGNNRNSRERQRRNEPKNNELKVKEINVAEGVGADAATQDGNSERNQQGRRRRRRGRGGRQGAEGEVNQTNANEIQTSDNPIDQAIQAAEEQNLADKIADSVANGENAQQASEENGEPRRRRRRRRRSGGNSGATEGSNGNQNAADNDSDNTIAETEGTAETAPADTVTSSASAENSSQPEQSGAQTAPKVEVANADVQEKAITEKVTATTEMPGSATPAADNVEPMIDANPVQEAPLAPEAKEVVLATEVVAVTETAQEAVEAQTEQEEAPVAEAVAAPQPTSEEVKPVAVSPALNQQELLEVVNQAGMLWVETDREKWTVVQDRLAAEPKPLRTPRIRKPVERVDSENLVLVETKPEFRQQA